MVPRAFAEFQNCYIHRDTYDAINKIVICSQFMP